MRLEGKKKKDERAQRPAHFNFFFLISLFQSSGSAVEELEDLSGSWCTTKEGGEKGQVHRGVDEPGWFWVNAAWRRQRLRRQQHWLDEQHGIHGHADIWICPGAAGHHGGNSGHPAA